MRVAVVGGGHAGLLAALALAIIGHRVTLFEEHHRPGVPPHCTGVVSKRYLDFIERLGVEPSSVDAIRYHGVKVLAGDAEIATLRADIYRVNRVKLEEKLLELAIGEGVDARMGVRVKEASGDGRLKHVRTEWYDAIVVAEGWKASLLRKAGLPVSEPLKAYGINYYVDRPEPRRDYIEVNSVDPRAPCFFSWRIPLERSTLKGLGSPLRPPKPPRDAQGVHGGVILLGPPQPLVARRLVSFGDASKLVKPLTGGGLAAQAEAIHIVLENNDGDGTGNPASLLYSAQRRVASRLAASYPLAVALYRDCLLQEAVEALKGEHIDVDFEFDYHMSPRNLAGRRQLRAALMLATRKPGVILRLGALIAKGILRQLVT